MLAEQRLAQGSQRELRLVVLTKDLHAAENVHQVFQGNIFGIGKPGQRADVFRSLQQMIGYRSLAAA